MLVDYTQGNKERQFYSSRNNTSLAFSSRQATVPICENFETSEHRNVTFEPGEVIGFLSREINMPRSRPDASSGTHLVAQKRRCSLKAKIARNFAFNCKMEKPGSF
jgi:hypothetical protein